jgi:hypothetical protein
MNILGTLYSILMLRAIQSREGWRDREPMMMLAIVNMLLLLLGFWNGLRRREEGPRSASGKHLSLPQTTETQES